MKFLLHCILFLFAASAQASDKLAELNTGEIITTADLIAYVNKRVDLKPVVRTLSGLKMALLELVETRLWVLEGERLGEPRIGGEKKRFDDIYALAIYRKHAPTCHRLANEQEAREYFLNNPEVFRLPVQVRLARVMIPVNKTIDNINADIWMGTQARAIAASAVTFDAIASHAARIYQDEVQGDLGWIFMTEDQPLLRIISNGSKNELIGPVRDGDFMYLFLILDKRESRLLKWEEVSTQVPQRALQNCQEQAKTKLRAEKMTQYGVVIDEDAIKRLSFKY